MQELRDELIAWAEMLLPDHPDDVEDVVQEVLLSLCRAGQAVLNRRAYAIAAVRWRCASIRRPGQAVVTVPLEVLDRSPCLEPLAA
jgi:DNA-directed RNA polymerase specialized sigma24 family protein